MPSDVILENEALVYHLSQRFYGIDKEDLVQAGFLGLTKAYKKFDESKGTKFSTFAFGYIYGEMYEAATGNRPIRIRKPEMRLYKAVMKTKELLENKYQRSVSYQEACEFTNVNYEMFLSILYSLSTNVSIDNTELHLSEKNNIDDMLLLKESLDNLTSLERSVIVHRYMEDLSQSDTAKVLSMSQAKVSRLEKSSKEKMQSFVNH